MSAAVSFKKATKQSAKLRLAMIGPPGSGKTYTGLTVATALGGKVAVIDTEKGSASKYADIFDFEVLELEGSFHPRRYIEAIHAAEEAGFTSIVIDSLSHAWIGEEGGLDLHDKAVQKQKTKNSYTAWGDVTPHHNALVQALIQSKCHIIATMRSKVEYAQEQQNGRTTIRKVGTAPMMRDGMEYEFDVVGDIDIDHVLVITKTRCPALADKAFPKPGADFMRPLLAWLGNTTPVQREQLKPAVPTNGNGQAKPADNAGPVVGAFLEAKIQETERTWIGKSLCTQGEVVASLLDWAAKKGCNKPIVQWPAKIAAQVRDELVALRKRFEQQKQPAAPKAMLETIDRACDQLSFTEDQLNEWLETVHRITPGTKLTEHQAQAVILDLQNLIREQDEAGRQQQEEDVSVPF